MELDKEAIELKAEIEQCEKNGQGRIYSEELKKKVINFHYKTGRTISSIGVELNIANQIISKWKAKYGKQRTAFVFGDGIRNDLRTKALCVQEYKETKATQGELSAKYNVSPGTVGNWINNFADNYEELLDTRDGVPYLVKETKMVYGDNNIEMVLGLKEEHMTELSHLIETMHKTGLTPGKTLMKEIDAKQKKTKAEIKTLKEADEILKKSKK